MGVVTKLGAGVAGFKEGQRVTSLGWCGKEGSGSWQQFVNVPAARLVALPDGISDEAGAQFYVSAAPAAGWGTAVWGGHVTACTACVSLLPPLPPAPPPPKKHTHHHTTTTTTTTRPPTHDHTATCTPHNGPRSTP
jgi:threonine dehydrogenase-like Zn-dependent dehydrogenase